MTNIIVWEWMNDLCLWQPYESNISNEINIHLTKYKKNLTTSTRTASASPVSPTKLELGPLNPYLSKYCIKFESTGIYQVEDNVNTSNTGM